MVTKCQNEKAKTAYPSLRHTRVYDIYAEIITEKKSV